MDRDQPAQPWRGRGRVGVAALVATVALLVVGLAVPTSAAGLREAPDEEHCIAYVVGQQAAGEYVVSAPDCYGSFSAAMFVASSGTWRLPADAPVTVLESPTAGVHYDGFETAATRPGTTTGAT